MSHVDEGALHAYLDGALEEYPTGEARRIRAHLERCAACAQALADARALRDQADLLLGIPDVDVSAPPLEELRTLARSDAATASPPRGIRLYRFGWAASVVLALGVGWMLRGGVPEAPSPSVTGAVSRTAAPTAEEAGRDLAADVPVATAPEEARAGAAMDEAPMAPTPGTPPARQESRMAEAVTDEPVPPALAGADVAVAELAAVDVSGAEEAATELADVALAEDEVVAESLVAPTGMTELQAGAVAEAPDAAQVADAEVAVMAGGSGAATTTEAAGDDVAVSGERSALAARSAGVSSALQVESFASRERDARRVDTDDVAEPGSLVVPGLEVLSIVWREEGVVPAGVRVLQRLSEGGTLELIHLPAGFDPGSVEAAEPDVGELVVPRDQGWLIMRGPLSEEEFRSMLERMDAPVPE